VLFACPGYGQTKALTFEPFVDMAMVCTILYTYLSIWLARIYIDPLCP
jgi:hypothetical protein